MRTPGQGAANLRVTYVLISTGGTGGAPPPPGIRRYRVSLNVNASNVTNRANFDNPAGDERLPATFLVLNSLRGGGGFPRQAKLGVRFTF